MDNPRLRSPFNSTDNVKSVGLNDIEAVEKELAKGIYAGVIIEGIQGVAGIFEPTDDFMQNLRKLCDRYGAVLILDEIQSGYGRTGRFFAHQYRCRIHINMDNLCIYRKFLFTLKLAEQGTFSEYI